MRYFQVGSWLIAIVVLTGCAKVNFLQPPVADVRPQREAHQKAAIESFEKKRTMAELQSARMRFLEGDTAGSRQMIQSLLERQPDHFEARHLLAEVLLASNELRQAENILRGLVEDQPNNASAHVSLGDLLDASGCEAEAQALWDQAQALEPTNVLYASGNEFTGVRQVEHSNEISPQLNKTGTKRLTAKIATVDRATSEQGRDHLRDVLTNTKGDTVELRKTIDAAVASEPQNPSILIACAVHAMRVERPELAVAILTTGAKRFPSHAGVSRSLGAAHLQLGDAETAQVVLQHALSLDNTAALSYFLLGHSLALNGQQSQADEMLRQASKRDARYAR